MKVLLLSLLAFPLAVGCQKAAPGYTPVPQAKVEPVKSNIASLDELMPLDLGNQWTYSLLLTSSLGEKELGRTEGAVSYRVGKREGATALILFEQDGKLLEQQDWESSGKGLFQKSGSRSRTPFSTPQPLAQLPLDPGRTFSWKGSGPLPNGKVGPGRLEGAVRAPESVDTAMGTFSAIPVFTRTSYAKGHCDNVSWYRPGIGLVRVRQEMKDDVTGRTQLILLTLTQYAIKGVKTKQ